MPRGDGTGPAGMGPMTGRAAGYCAGYPVLGFMNPISGRGGGGWGRGGGGWGRRNQFYATGLAGWQRAGYDNPAWGGAIPSYGTAPYATPYGAPTREQELEALQNQARYTEDALDGIRERIGELEAGAKKK
jgi:Family of unknown function (DUF5320)